jgi:transposase
VLVELGLLEQRHKAVLEVLNGATVTDVARRSGVARQTVHDWLRRYAGNGMAALSDRSSKPASCPHQMSPEVEAKLCCLRREHPVGDHRPSATPSPKRSPLSPAARRSTGHWCADLHESRTRAFVVPLPNGGDGHPKEPDQGGYPTTTRERRALSCQGSLGRHPQALLGALV